MFSNVWIPLLYRDYPMKTAVSDHDPIQAKFAQTRQELADALIERDSEIDLILTALICREHALLVGPPGCAKSLLLDSLLTWTGGKKFAILLTKFTVPEEVFGPISVIGLKDDRYTRITTGKLPEADFAFMDETFKASSAILNSLLQILNERVYDRGHGIPQPVPLKFCLAASNEWPSLESGKELTALLDRFLLRKSVRPILTAGGRSRLLWERDHSPQLSRSITLAEIDQAHVEARCLPWSATAREAFENIVRELSKEGVQPGDRRQFKSVTAAQAYAYLQGGDRVEPEHLEILAHTLWDAPEGQPEKTAQVVARIANPPRHADQSVVVGGGASSHRHGHPQLDPGRCGNRQVG